MTAIRLRDVSIDFPVYQGSSRSLKKTLMRAGAGGRILADASHRLVVHALDNISLEDRKSVV